MTPEREREIRDWPYLQTPPEMMWEASRELLEEIDRLREENDQLRDQNANLKKQFFEKFHALNEMDKKLAVAEDQLQLGLDFYNLDTVTWIEKYGPGMTTKELGNKFREALKAIRGSK